MQRFTTDILIYFAATRHNRSSNDIYIPIRELLLLLLLLLRCCSSSRTENYQLEAFRGTFNKTRQSLSPLFQPNSLTFSEVFTTLSLSLSLCLIEKVKKSIFEVFYAEKEIFIFVIFQASISHSLSLSFSLSLLLSLYLLELKSFLEKQLKRICNNQ